MDGPVRRLFPRWVEVEEGTFASRTSPPPFALERQAIVGAVPGRVREFTTARAGARRALSRLGVAERPIPVGAGRDPVWPPGIVGSLTHCATYWAAVVGRASTVTSLGVDAEMHRPLPAAVHPLVLTRAERTMTAELTASMARVHWDCVVFSAKESAFKFWFPLDRRWTDPLECTISIDPRRERFLARRADGATVQGAWVGDSTRIFTGAWA